MEAARARARPVVATRPLLDVVRPAAPPLGDAEGEGEGEVPEPPPPFELDWGVATVPLMRRALDLNASKLFGPFSMALTEKTMPSPQWEAPVGVC